VQHQIVKKRIQFCLIVAGIIVLFDAVASAVSRAFLVDYTILTWASYILYVAAGYLGRQSFDQPTGIAAGLGAGLADSTIGWYLSSVIRPFVPFAQPNYTPLMTVIVIITVSMVGALFGFVGTWVYQLVNRSNPSSDA